VSAGASGSKRHDADDLLKLALSRPHDAIAGAREILAGRPGPYEASIAHQAAGIVLRDIGDVNAAVGELRSALRAARRADSHEREADVLASLGVALVHANHTARGLAALDQAVGLTEGVLLGRMLHRRGAVLWFLGRYPAALDDLRHAVSLLRRGGDLAWTARALSARGLVYLQLGSPARADADYQAAGRLYAQTSQELESIYAVFNRASAAYRSGDLPAALSLLDETAARYQPLNVPTTDVSMDRCDVLLAAGLTGDALAEADAALDDIEQARGLSSWRAELLLKAASCALAADRPQAALERAQAACRLFQLQQRAWWEAHARLIEVQARVAIGPSSSRLLVAAKRAALRLDELASRDAAQAHLLVGRVALDLRRRGEADVHLTLAARSRRHGPPMDRVVGWLSAALRAEAAGDLRPMLSACRRGLEVLDEHRWTLGATELRAQATAHGAELAALGQRHAARQHRPRLLLAWSERWRATALAVPAVRPPAGAALAADLAALRQANVRLAEARRQGTPTAVHDREQLRLEKAIRSRSLQARGTRAAGHAVADIAQLLEALGSTQLIEIVDVDGKLQVLFAAAGRVRQLQAGNTDEVTRAADFARFALRRLARRRPGDDLESAAAILRAAGPELQRAILGPAAGLLHDGPVVVIPPGKLHGIPWALMPALSDRVFSVAPSAGAWLRGHALRPPSRSRVVLARGPGLSTDGAEVALLAELYKDATLLSGPEATAAGLLSAMDGAWLAHIAAHGSFRADSPLFSSLRMHDGPLTVYDFEQLHRSPHWLILPSCDSGVLAPAGADELLGLAASLLPLGTAGLIVSMVPVNDRAVMPLMMSLHQCLRAGQSLAEAMCSVRRDSTGDVIEHAAAASMLALGACLSRFLVHVLVHRVIHPVRTYTPATVRQCSRNGPEGIGLMEKQPISSVCTNVSLPALG
jgi:CHAT domain-containing protein